MYVCFHVVRATNLYVWLACATPFYIIRTHLIPQTNDSPSVDVEEIQKA